MGKYQRPLLRTFIWLILFCLPVSAFGADKVTLQLKWFHQFQFAGYYAAKEKGFYAAEGLDVVFRQRDIKTSYIDDVLEGQAQYGTSDAGLLFSRLQGKPVVVLAQIFQHSPLVLLTLKESGLRTPYELAGKKVMIDTVGFSDAPANGMLFKALGSFDQFQPIQMTFRYEDLSENKVDAVVAYVTDQPFKFQEVGVEVNILDPRDYGVDFYGDNLFTTEKEIREHPQRVEKMIRATLKGWHYALQHRDEIVELILKKYNPQKLSRKHLLYEAEQTEKMIVSNFIELGSFESSRFTKIAETYVALGLTDKTSVDQDFLYASNKSLLDLTPEERAWLDAHPVIRVHNEKDWPPFNYFEYGSPRGLSIDYMNLVAAQLGIQIEYVSGPSWNEFLGMVKRKELDVMLNIVKTEDRMKYLLYTEPYIKNPNVIVSSQESPYETIQALFGKTVAFPKGFFYEEVLTKSFPQIKRLPVEDTLASLKAVTFGRADAALGEAAPVRTLINKNLLSGLQISGEVDIGNPDLANLRLGVRDDWPLLQSALLKAMAAITPQEMNQIRQKWIGADEQPASQETAVPIAYGRLIAYGIAVFLILSLLAWLLIKTIKKEQIAVHFGSPWFRGLVLAVLSVFVLVVAFLGWYMLERNKTEHLFDVDENLRGILSVSEDRFDLWLKERISYLALLGRDPELVAITQRLLQVEPNKRALLASSALREARFFFQSTEDIFSNIGFFVIDPDHVSIGSMRDANLGSRNLISKQNPELLQRAFQGKVGFVPPMTSDVNLGNSAKSDNAAKPPTMFFIGPVQDTDGRILAVMTLRVDPWKDFARALTSFGNGASRESYAFDRNGVMLSSSRFEGQLRRIGLLAEDQTSALSIEIRDPGGNMIEGYRPDIERSQQPLTQMVSHALALRQQMERAGIRQGHSPIESNIEGYRDYRGVPVFGAWLWNADLDIGLAVEVDVDEALSHYYRTRVTIFSILGFTLVLSVGAILFVLIIGERTSRALMRARDNLEKKVTERTADLRKLSQATENSPASVVVTDKKGTIEYVNPRFSEVTGYAAEEAIGQNPSVLKSGDLPESYYQELWDTIISGKVWRGEFKNKRKNGEEFWESASISPIKNEEGEITHFVAVKEDITEQKKIRESLRESEARFRVIFEQAAVGLAMLDIEGKPYLSNRALHKFLGYNAEEFKSMSFADFTYPADVEIDTELFNELIKGERNSYSLEKRYVRKDQEVVWALITTAAIRNEAGDIDNFVGMAIDISPMKDAEQELSQARAEAEAANQAKSDFLANMSHEIRTPMNAVIGMSYLALKTELTPKQKDYLDKIQSSANSLLGIINDILDFSKIEAGKLDMESVEFNLDDVLDNLANLVTVKAQEKEDLEVLFATAREVPRFLVGDPLRLGQVLINLANNAVKFTKSGEIVVSTELLEQDEAGLTIKFSVRDTGIGLTKDQIGKLFQSFSQADTSTTRKFGGTGLGLTISKRLVQMMGGEIWLDSEPGQGTTFSFTAHFGLGKETVKKRLVPSSDLRGMKALVVDDSAASRNILQDILESFSFEVTPAASAEEGLEEIQRADTDQPYELVLMDWKMPGLNGLAASRRIKNHPALGKIPAIILVTAYGREEIMQQAEQIGLDGFLIKPVSPSVLFDTIMHAFGEGMPKASRISERNEEIEDLKNLQGARVLLVEDNEINQQVAMEILQGAGLIVTVANDGQEGVDAAKKAPYDAILMDIQMPVMDGYEATRKIREWESVSANADSDVWGTEDRGQRAGDRGQRTEVRGQKTDDRKENAEVGLRPVGAIGAYAPEGMRNGENGMGNGEWGMRNKDEEKSDLKSEIRNHKSEIENIPIIAMTAHAMAGDDKKSIEAGMNDHVTKPIDPDQLFATLQKWIKPDAKRDAVQGPPVFAGPAEPGPAVPVEDQLPESLPGFDLAAGLKRLRGNKRLYRKLLVDFGTKYTETAREVREALDANNFEQAHSLVHNLKGLAGNLEATDLQDSAVEMEKLVKGDQKETSSNDQLNRKFLEFEKAINQALEAVQTLGLPAEEKINGPSAELPAEIPAEQLKEVSDRIKNATDMGDVMQIQSIANELKSVNDALAPFCDKIIQLAEDFDFDGIQRCVDEMDR